MCLRFMFLLTTRLAAWLRLARREETRKTAEILILRHQLAVLQQQPRRPELNWADRALLATLLAVIPKARRHGLRLLVTPDTILRWHRDIARRRRAARSKRGKTGRPATRRNIRALVLRLPRENPRLGLPQDPRRTGRAGGRSVRLLHSRPPRWHPGLRPGRDRARQQAHPHPGSHAASHRGLDRPAGPQPDHGSRRAGAPGQVHDPRPRLELHRR